MIRLANTLQRPQNYRGKYLSLINGPQFLKPSKTEWPGPLVQGGRVSLYLTPMNGAMGKAK